MSVTDEVRGQLDVKFQVLFPTLDERQRRLMMGAETRNLGHTRAAQVSETTVRKGVDELEAGEEPLSRVRRPVVAGRGPQILILTNGAIRCRRCTGR